MRVFSLNRIQGLGSCGVSEEYVLEIDLYKVYFYNSGAVYLIFVTPFTYGTEASRFRYRKTWKNNLLNKVIGT